MVELNSVLDFACCTCGKAVTVEVKCECKGLTTWRGQVAAVQVPCPHCRVLNEIYFEPTGPIRDVHRCWTPRPVLELEPSLN
jgi:hypothetical protein